ncbi:MAG: hypothetical protein ACXADY_01870 [Candidatus Hodarchaeales archaeon]
MVYGLASKKKLFNLTLVVITLSVVLGTCYDGFQAKLESPNFRDLTENPTNWAYNFSDDFTDENETGDKWVDISTDGVMTRGGGILKATSFGETVDKIWHGPQWVHNFGANIDDFELNLSPYCSNTGLHSYQGRLNVSLFTGDNATGLAIFSVCWGDLWYYVTDSFISLDEIDIPLFTTGIGSMYNDWYDENTDNVSLVRKNTDDIVFSINSLEKWSSSNSSSTSIRSLSVQLSQWWDHPPPPKLSLRSVTFGGHTGSSNTTNSEITTTTSTRITTTTTTMTSTMTKNSETTFPSLTPGFTFIQGLLIGVVVICFLSKKNKKLRDDL